MGRKHRISAGAIIIYSNKILLVRYADRQGKTFLVGPVGGVNNEEGLSQAVVREVKEETGIEVVPSKVPHSKLWGITGRGATPPQFTDEAAFIPPAS